MADGPVARIGASAHGAPSGGGRRAAEATGGGAEAPEITLRGLLLGALVTVVFMAANVYMGLKTGMTFSSSIPAAMISMGALRLVGGAGILENNIVQTQASAAGTLCNVILVLPGLVLIGHWHGFPFWQTAAVCGLGGLLGVAYSIPLRRALVVEGGLPYPEGRAAAEVLRAGAGAGQDARGARAAGGLGTLLGAAGVAAAIGLATNGFRVLAESVHGSVTVGGAVFRAGTGFSLALLGVGYLVGIGACLALLAGFAIAWGAAVPTLTALGAGVGQPPGEAAETAWADVRLMGAGLIAVGGLWTIATLARPIAESIRTALGSGGAARGGAVPRAERDAPIGLVAGGAAGLALPLAALFWWFAAEAGPSGAIVGFVVAASLFAILFGFLMAATCGYLAGLLGSSSSPISGIGILTTMAAALLLPHLLGPPAGPEGGRFVVAAALLLAAVIVTVASIANDNLQDLKTGQIVGATPWRQQAALALGVCVGAAVIAPLLGLLYEAYGFVGALPREGMEPGNALPAPQATLMTRIATGIVEGTLPWRMVLAGAGLGAGLVAVEAALRRRGLTFPALTVGIGMYLPPTVVVTIAAGGVVGWLAERRLRRHREPEAIKACDRERAGEATREAARQRGVLLASGFLVGESLVGVLLAGADAVAGHASALALVGPDFAPAAALGAGTFAAALFILYRLVSRAPSRQPGR